MLSLCMIVKDEEEVLERCLNSIAGLYDQLIIVDTGSTDSTKKIAKKYTDLIYDFQWINDFSAARNFSFSKATEPWIMWLDADDIIKPEQIVKIKQLLADQQRLVGCDAILMKYNYVHDQNGEPTAVLHRERILRASCNFEWKGRIHEAIILNGNGLVTDIEIDHFRTDKGLTRDLGRNLPLMLQEVKDHPNDPRILYYAGQELEENGFPDLAIVQFKKYIDVATWHDQKTFARFKIARCYHSLGNIESAKQAALECISEDTRFAEPLFLLGILLFDQGKWEQAAFWFEKAATTDRPDTLEMIQDEYYTWRPLAKLVQCYQNLRLYEKALQANDRLIKIFPDMKSLAEDRLFLLQKRVESKQQKKVEGIVRLNLGSGGKRLSGHINADLYPEAGVDEVFSLDDVPYCSESVDEIASEHALEHLPRLKGLAAIAEWNRVLKPGGRLWLKVPDLELCCKAFLDSPEDLRERWYLHTIYGIQDYRNSTYNYDKHLVNEGQIHYTGFTKDRLTNILKENGFEVDHIGNYDGWGTPSIECTAHKVIKENPLKYDRVGFYSPLCFSEDDGPDRIRRINVVKEMKRQGLNVTHFSTIEQICEYDTIILYTYGENELAVAETAKQAGKKVFVDCCEDLTTFPNQQQIFELADSVICCSTLIAEKFAERYKCKTDVIFDAYEVGPIKTPEQTQAPKVVYCGYGGNAKHAEKLRPLIEAAGMSLVIISEWEQHDIKWTLDSWLYDITKHDIVIAPQDAKLQPAKSNNKVTQAMALGMPVICSDLQSYKEVINNDVNGFICSTEQQWEQAFEKLKDYETRKKIGEAARISVSDYSIQSVVDKWKQLLIKEQEIQQTTRRVAIINSSLQNPYQSYGEHWIDGFKDAGCTVDVFGYDQVENLPAGYDLYFFVEIRYDPTKISECAHPRALYCWDSHVAGIEHYQHALDHFDIGLIASKIDTERLKEKGYNVYWIPEACNSRVHRDLHLNRDLDLTFIGQQDNQIKREGYTRLDFLKYLDKKYKTFIGRSFYGDYYSHWLNKAKLAFDRPITYDIGTRLFEAAACGCLVLYPKPYLPTGLEDLMEQGVHYISYDDTIEGLDEKIQYYLDHEDERKKIALRAQAHVLTSHTYKQRAEQALQIVEQFVNKEQAEVTIVVPLYNNKTYLQMFLESIEACTEQPVEIIISDAGSTKPEVIEYLQQLKAEGRNVLIPKQRQCFSETINAGLQQVKTRYVCLMNDDVIASKGWLTPLLDQVKQKDVGAVGAFSNCALGWTHNTVVNCGGVDLVPAMTVEQIEPIRKQLYTCSAPHDQIGKVHQREWIAFWNALMPTDVVKKVGLLDTKFKNGGEDKDYCLRMRKLGYKIYQRFDSFLFHYGGKTRKINEQENYTKHHQEDQHNNTYLVEKYAKKTIVFYTGPAYERWSPLSIERGGIGGSETCCIHIAEQFDKLGYRVFVFNDCGDQAGTYNNVTYCNYTEFAEFSTMNHIDIFISSRRPEVFSLQIRADQKHTWVHDIWLSNDQNANIYQDKVDSYMVLSPWHKQFLSKYHKIPQDKLWVTKNGVDLTRFEGIEQKDPHRLIYSSSPDRGLDILLDLFPQIKEKVPEANLHIFYGFDNWNKAIEQRDDPQEKKIRDKILQGIKQPGVHYHGRVDQKQLAHEFMKAKVWSYCTAFWETHCITALEAMLAETIPVTTDLAALNTTVGNYGVLVQGNNWTPEYQDRFVDEVVKILSNDYSSLKFTPKQAKQRVIEQHNWPLIAKQWEQHFKAFIPA